jgi:hypothetical protein
MIGGPWLKAMLALRVCWSRVFRVRSTRTSPIPV